MGRDAPGAFDPVAQGGREKDPAFLADGHELQRLDPAGDDPSDGEGDRLSAIDRAVEHRSISEGAVVVDLDGVLDRGLGGVRVGGWFEDLILEAGSGDLDTGPLGIAFQKVAGLSPLAVVMVVSREAVRSLIASPACRISSSSSRPLRFARLSRRPAMRAA